MTGFPPDPSQHDPLAVFQPPDPQAPRPRAGNMALTVLAWVVIVLVTGGLFAVVNFMPAMAGSDDQSDEIGLLLMRIQSQYMVGAARSPLLGGGAAVSGEAFLSQVDALNVGGVGQRQRAVVLIAELGGSDEGATALTALEQLITLHDGTPQAAVLSESQQDVQALLRTLYPLEPSEDERLVDRVDALAANDRDLLTDELGWFGELALHPPGADAQARADVLDPAGSVFVTFITVFVLACLAGFIGFVLLVVGGVLTMTGRLRNRLGPSAPRHGVYAETFAIWLLFFTGLQVVMGLLSQISPSNTLFIAAMGFFASLVVLGWPCVRGISFGEMMREIGWTKGRGVAVETAAGVVGYLGGLPLLVFGALITVMLTFAQAAMASGEISPFAPAGGPAHPIVLDIQGGSWWSILQLYLVASVAAPVVEETMFRGVLYRHLRDASRSMGTIASVLLSGVVSGFIFAAIHPQGWVAVPALMGLAFAFSLAREWRGTIWPAVVMHGLSNGLVMTLLVTLVA